MKRIAFIMCLILTSLSAYSLHNIRVGQTLTLYYSVGMTGWSPVRWECNSSDVSIISQSGWHCTVKGIADTNDHFVTVTLYYTNGRFTNYIHEYVNVLPNEPREVSLKYSSLTMDMGESKTLEASVYPSYVDYTLSWKSSNESVATVNNGVVKGIGAGKTTVTVTTQNNKSSNCSVTVYDPNPQGMTISQPSSMTVGDACDISASFSPQYSRSSVTWTSSNWNVLAVSGRGSYGGHVTALNPGQAKLTAKSANGLESVKEVTVYEPPFTITSQNPNDNATDVPVLSTLQLDFSLPITIANQDDIKLVGNGKEVKGSLAYYDNTVSFKPERALEPYTAYTWTIPQGSVLNQWNTSYSQTITIPFTTGGLSPLDLTVSLPSGTVEPGDQIELKASEPDAVIYYTLDGTEPTEQSMVYKEPVTINQNLTLRAFAFKDGYVKPQINAPYTITELCVVRKYPLLEKIYQYDKVNPYIEYAKEMKPGAQFNELKVTTDKDQLVNGTFIANGKFLVFVPNSPLIPGHHYTITVPEGALVMQNGDINKAISWTFESGLYIRSIAAGGDFSLGLRSDDVLLLWGAVPYRTRGFIDILSKYHDSLVVIAEDVRKIDCGTTHCLFVDNSNQLYGWGKQLCHEIGLPSLAYADTPQLLDKNVSLFSAGGQASIWTSSGQTKGLGNNICHQLSEDVETVYSTPTTLTLPEKPVKQIESGNGNTYLLTTDGTLYGWGDNRFTQLLNYNHSMLTEPVVLMQDVDTFAVSKNNFGNVAVIKKDGTLWTWGDNRQGQLGNGEKSYYSHPLQIMDNVLSIAVGNEFMAAVTKNHELWMWGRNHYGQLGNNGGSSVVPLKVMDGITSVSLGDRFTMALDETGGIWQWGLERTSDTDYQSDGSPKVLFKGRQKDAISQLTIVNANIHVAPGEKAVACVIPTPYSATLKQWQWTSGDESVALVNERGVITAVGNGTTNVKITTDNGIEASCIVTVDDSYLAITRILLPSEPFDVYDLRGRMILSKTTSLDGLSKGIYIVGNNKIIVK